ncbi:MASE1 domain-containing protein [Dolichospermum sp. ST_con]|nr:MASE1 domain-containing protein [Dolichospermum sp. ST_con]MDD1418566.1 MASE1 domain-containing protein [Dolichospermum sp. ST_sed1]MDD1423282.1 MASE1 domain-containing protein [Dolichospermum sp. ST_sed9]MDD1433639.1 MASE1 domain-containing protein [Dolichospermum sp. ST_sed6]MDD1437396.1 MASE1 domain-containing protein [Dolichospermum sp. ST_sed10]MDD1440435.1 MASE1 domain-containing protein [Dolichospermum sp. ST_sed3]MDD1447571.1 MASE1 domain-containing protein [Dolichospermum sp. ST_s
MKFNFPLVRVRLVLIIVLGFVYYQTAQFSRILASTSQNVTPVWPPDGFATAAILLFGYWIWPGVLIGSFLANIWAFINTTNIITLFDSILQVLAIAIGTTSGTLLGSFLLRKLVTEYSPLERLSDVSKFLVFTGMIGPMVNATAGVTALTLGGKIPISNYPQVWLTWWISNVAGIFIFTPALLSWGELFKEYLLNSKTDFKINLKAINFLQIAEALILLKIVFLICKNAFFSTYFIEYMIIPCLVWAVFRFGKLTATNLIVFIAVIAVLGTVRGLGAFNLSNLNDSLTLLQCFIGVIVLTTLVLNAVLAEKSAAMLILKNSQMQLLDKSLELQQTAEILEAKKEKLTQQNLELEVAKQNAIDANRSKSQFLTNMSHELRTPLNGILGIAQVFQDLSKLTTEEKEDIEIIYQSGVHLLTLIDDILDISKIEAGKIELEPQNFNFPDFLKEIVKICRYCAMEKNINFSYQIDTNIPVIINADEKRLKQILLNILGNAIKFTDRGEVNFIVDIISETAKDKSFYLTKVKFKVTDTGIGINPEKSATIFLPFEQVAESKLKSQGTGLGLAISQKIAQMMGGEIKVTSELSQGSIFSLELGLLTEKFQDVEKPENKFDANFSQKYPLKIMIAEDNLVNQKIASKLFQKLGYQVTIVNHGIEALNSLKQEMYDVIFMDIQMPELDGIETTKAIYQEWGEINRPYIIALTANAMPTDRDKCFSVGMDDYISKPVKIEKIVESIQLMQQRRF